MNKKILLMSVTILISFILATPLVSAMGVKRNLSQNLTGTATICDPTTVPAGYFAPGITKYVGPKGSVVPPAVPPNTDNRKLSLQSGATFFGVIDTEPLGIGTMESTALIGLMDLEAGEGWGVFKWVWTFDNDDCVGTIEGIYKGKQTVSPPSMTIIGTALLCKGTGDLQNVKIEVTDYEATLDLITFTTAGFDATIDGTIWGWNP